MVQTHTHRTHLLALDLPPGSWQHALRLAPAIDAAFEGTPASLAIVVFSEQLRTPPSVALREVEQFLQQVYTHAWRRAVAHDRLLTDITVYLIPGASHDAHAQASVQRWARQHAPHLHAAYTLEGACDARMLERLLLVPVHALPWANDPASDTVAHAPAALAPAPTPAFPHVPSVALGGTFDHLHIGHKLLLSIAALCATQRLIVGVTSTELLANKKHRAYVEPIAHRLAAVRRFLRAFRMPFGALDLEVVPISDVCGPAATDPALDLLVVTEETAKGAETIAAERMKNQVPPTDVHVVSLVDAGAHQKVGSTAIRGWLEARGAPKPPACATPLDMDLAAAQEAAPAAAGVPALGLSNRAEAPEAHAPLTAPPNPQQLQSETLWLELEKLYGHGYELLSVDVDARSQLVASTCKATTPAHAVVRLFDGRARFKPLMPPLEGHTLSITRVRFSPDGQYVLTSSRDRSWRLFRHDGHAHVAYAGERAHARIVWDCAWDPLGSYFATASRDKTVKVWRLDDAQRYVLCATLALDDAAVAVAIGPHGALAVGLERGDVRVYVPEDAARTTYTSTLILPRHHTGAVHALAFRPEGGWQDVYDRVPYALLSAGEDGCVRLVSWVH